MLWLNWRQFRVQAVIAATAIAVVAIALITTGFSVRSRFKAAGLPACHVHHDCQHVASLTSRRCARPSRTRCSSTSACCSSSRYPR